MEELIYFLRVAVAAICGIAIGYERKNRAKEAGIRTHCIVACAAALMMIVSKYGFYDLIEQSVLNEAGVKLDPSRVASSIVSGVGFLGAGMIFVQKHTVTGLTTAAGIWATAGIGMAVGAGMYIIGILVTVFMIVAQILLHRDNKFLSVPHYKIITVKNVDKSAYQSELCDILKSYGAVIEDISVNRSEDKAYSYTVTAEIPGTVDEDKILESINYESSIKSAK